MLQIAVSKQQEIAWMKLSWLKLKKKCMSTSLLRDQKECFNVSHFSLLVLLRFHFWLCTPLVHAMIHKLFSPFFALIVISFLLEIEWKRSATHILLRFVNLRLLLNLNFITDQLCFSEQSKTFIQQQPHLIKLFVHIAFICRHINKQCMTRWIEPHNCQPLNLKCMCTLFCTSFWVSRFEK